MASGSNPGTLALKNRLGSAVHFLLECFGSIHYLNSAKCISFVLKDIGTYLYQMDAISLRKAFSEVPFITMDRVGFLKKETPDRLDIKNGEELGFTPQETPEKRDFNDGELGSIKQDTSELGAAPENTSAGLDSFEDSQLRGDVKIGELRLLFFVGHLSINGKTHLKNIFEDLCNRAPQEVSKGLSIPMIEKLSYSKKYEEYFRTDPSRHLELQEAFYSLFEHLRQDSASFQNNSNSNCINAKNTTKRSFEDVFPDTTKSHKHSKTTVWEQDDSTSTSEVISCSSNDEISFHTNETGIALPCNSLEEIVCVDRKTSNCVLQEEQKPFLTTASNIVAPDKELVSRRIRSSVVYLKTFFKLKHKGKVMGVILQVLEDVERFFSVSSILDKVDMIQNSFVSLFSKDTSTTDSSCSPSSKVVPHLDEHERKMLYFYYLLTFGGSKKYNVLFEAFHGSNGVVKTELPTIQTSDSEQLSYFKSLSRLFTVKSDGTVKPYPLLDLYLLKSFKSFVFKSYDSEISDNKISVKNPTLQSQNIWCYDNLVYKRLCSFIGYLLHCFGQQPCDRLTKCISYVFPDIEMFLNELTRERQQELFSSIPYTDLKSNNYMILTSAWKLDRTYALVYEYFHLHLVANVALCGKTRAQELINDFLRSRPNNFKLRGRGSWFKKLKSSKFLHFDGESNVTLPYLFYSATGNTISMSQAYGFEFCVSEEILKGLGFPLDILETLTERIVDGIACLLDFFQPNIHSGFVEVVLYIIKQGSAFFELPQSYQEAVIKKCFNGFRVDDRGHVAYSQLLRKQKNRTTISRPRQLLLCVSYIIGEKVSMHYRDAFISYQMRTRQNKTFSVEKQLAFFKNRKHLFFVDDNGFVNLWKMQYIEFDYISIVLNSHNDLNATISFPKIKTETLVKSFQTNDSTANSQCSHMTFDEITIKKEPLDLTESTL